MEHIEPSLETGINQASSHKHDDDSITTAIITAASDADRDHVRDLCCHHRYVALNIFEMLATMLAINSTKQSP